MTPRETVQAAFLFKQTRPIPYWLQWDDSLEPQLDQYYGFPAWRKRIVPYMFGRHVGFRLDPLPDGRIREAFGSIVQEGNVLHVEKPVLPEATLAGYQWPDPESLIDWDEVRAEYADRADSFRVCGLAMGLFERSWLMRGFEPLLMDMLSESAFVHKLLDGVCDFHLQMMDRLIERIPMEAYFGGDDWCDQRTVMMGIRLWRQFFKPRLAKLIEHAHSLGKPYVLHSCGNLSPLIDDLMEIGLDALESLQAEAMNVYKAKKKVAGKLVLIGGMGVQRIIPFGSPDEVRAETTRLIDELGQGGGFVLAPSKPLPAGTPVGNAVAFIETALQENPT